MKNFFRNLGYKLQNSLVGRNGPDDLYRLMNIVALIIIMLDLFIRNRIASAILYIVALGLIVASICRVYSKNVSKRRQENYKYVVFKNNIKSKFKLLSDKWKYRKTHIFRTCPNCKKTLRLPKKKGEHTVTCPICKTKFSVKVK